MVSALARVVSHGAEHPNAQAVRRLAEAFKPGDIAAIEAAIGPEAVWHLPGGSLISGEHHGRNGILGFLARIVGLSEGTFTFDVIDVLASDRRAALLFRGRGERDGRTLDNPTCLVDTFEDGVARELHEYVGDLHHVEGFWA